MSHSVPVRSHHALLVVDVQNDFLPGGALGVPGGDAIIPTINRVIPLFDTIVFTRDWHPADHCSFDSAPRFVDRSWPVHCVADTPGAAFHTDLTIPDNAIIISKAVTADREAYSSFQETALAAQLKSRGITMIYICGLATDYCVRFSAIDAIHAGFRVRIITDAVRGIDVPAGSARKAMEDMMVAGAEPVQSDLLVRMQD
ncbi:nicotinamidase [bacterium]|nr:nicotinamidase [candidate division CSSED10-310 bacterium]